MRTRIFVTSLFNVLRKMQRRHSSNTDNVPPERNRSQALSSEASVDEGGVFESLKAEAASPPVLFSSLSGLPASSLPATPFPPSLVLGASASGGDVFIQMPASREEGGGRGEGSTYHHRQPHHHFHHGGHRGSSLLQHVGGDHRAHSDDGGDEQPGTPAPALSELKAVVCWLQKGLPFILILLAKLCFQHKLGIAVCIGMATTFAYANSTLREQVSLKEKRSVLAILWILAFLAGNTLYVLYTFNSQQLYNSLIFLKPNLETLDFFDLLWIVGIVDFVLKYITIALKCLVVALPKIILAVKSKIHPPPFSACGLSRKLTWGNCASRLLWRPLGLSRREAWDMQEKQGDVLHVDPSRRGLVTAWRGGRCSKASVTRTQESTRQSSTCFPGPERAKESWQPN
ncbi:ring finger protein, transmembrane 2 [Phyllostomus discolor]|uniref:Ring finger protein, transmembrane 2 n=1 Tax=Phyllostomus discolor TaxID=89673 RepID=A0A833YYH9_9CHIR|nr:ring finger protein, transmembrane 2 [Phyllostomus discolor]